MLCYGVPGAETLCQDSLQGNFTLPSDPRGLTVKYARNGGSVDTETEGGNRFAIIALVICHSPLQEKARQAQSCWDTLHSQGSPWDGVLQSITHRVMISPGYHPHGCPSRPLGFLAAHGRTLRLFCPRRAVRAPGEQDMTIKAA